MSLSISIVECGSPPSAKLLRALAPFGLLTKRTSLPTTTPPASSRVASVLACAGGSLVLVTGPSGCGKSTLLRAVSDAAHAEHRPVVDATELLRAAPSDRPIVDLLAGPLLDTLRLLAAAGLAEPMLWARAAGELSEGQRLRLGLALAMAQVRPGTRTVLLIDECCSTLDRVTAHGVARTLRRWVSNQPQVLVVCATAHNDLATPLCADLVLKPSFQENANAHAD